jgi:hypothetical protein
MKTVDVNGQAWHLPLLISWQDDLLPSGGTRTWKVTLTFNSN